MAKLTTEEFIARAKAEHGDRYDYSKVEINHGVGSTDHFSALNIWMFENKFVSLPSHLKTIEPMEVHGSQERCVIQKLQK